MMKKTGALVLAALIFAGNVYAEINTHTKMRRVLQYASPGAMASITERWDGVEDMQAFIDRAVVWRDGQPHITAAQIIAKETDWQAAKTQRDNLAARELLISRREAAIIRRLAIDELRAEEKIP